ncbi:MAG: GNAT family N-acetyltransferase [Cryobacterium sp.]|nr:GNAT family N-acetyltransferase [Oligoflexia bacterium]
MRAVSSPSERLETSRLVLWENRPGLGFGVNSEMSRSSIAFAAIEKDRTRMSRFLPWVSFTNSVKDSEDYLVQCLKNREKFEGFDYGIYLKNGDFIGNIGLHTVSRVSARAELGYWISGAHEGHGYISEAVRTLSLSCFEAHFHRLEIRCNAENLRSDYVARSTGFQLEGELREDCLECGSWRNTRIYGLLDSDRTNSLN